jgi:SAM-dependent methyltransferase
VTPQRNSGILEMDRGLIYRSPRAYQLAMLLLYRQHYCARQSALAEQVPPETSVVEACCGPGTLYSRHLRHKSVRYTGLDLNPVFVARLQGQGIDSRLWDMRSTEPLPQADYVVMQASLYHFLPDAGPVVDRMLNAAREEVMIAEPIHNLTTDHPRLSRMLAALTDAGAGPERQRFDERSLDGLLTAYQDHVRRVMPLAGGREKLYVLEGRGESTSI